MEQEKIGYKLKELRIKHNYTQEQLAEKLYISRQAISRWEQGISLPDYDTLIKLCNLYCISLDELFFEQKNSDWIVENYLKLFYEKNKLKCTKNIIIAFLILVVILFSLYFTLVNYNKNSI